MSNHTSYGGYRNRVLLVLVGMSPAVLTETVFALTRGDLGDDYFVPTKVEVVTTRLGKERLVKALLDPVPSVPGGRFAKMWNNLGSLPALSFTAADVYVPADEDGAPFDDAHSKPQLEAIGDLMLQRLQAHASQPDTAVVTSISGGRKSMSHLAGTALSLVARPQDRLVHVIVHPASLETCDAFYFPDPKRTTKYDCWDETGRKALQIDPAVARVELALVPFLLLKDRLPTIGATAGLSLSGLVSKLNSSHLPPRKLKLVIDLTSQAGGRAFLDGRPLLEANKTHGPIAPDHLAFLLSLARAKSKGVAVSPNDAEMLDLVRDQERIDVARGTSWDPTVRFNKVFPFFNQRNGASRDSLASLDDDDFRAVFDISDVPLSKSIRNARGSKNSSRLTRLNNILIAALPPDLLPDAYTIERFGKRGEQRHRLPETLNVEIIE